MSGTIQLAKSTAVESETDRRKFFVDQRSKATSFWKSSLRFPIAWTVQTSPQAD
jgi:hypothetical protein